MSCEYYLDYSHPFDDWMWKMFNLHCVKALEEFKRYIFLFPDYKSSYHIVDNFTMPAIPKNKQGEYYEKCVSILKHILYNHPNIDIKSISIDHLWAINEHEILKTTLSDNINSELRHKINGYLIDKKLNEYFGDLKDKSNISTLISYFHRHQNNNFTDVGLCNRNFERVVKYFGVQKTATLLFEISNYKDAPSYLYQQIYNDIKHNDKFGKEFLKVSC